MIDDLLPVEKVDEIRLNKSEISIPSGLRYFKILWFIILVLKKCSYSNKASILKLQFFNWGFSSEENLTQFYNLISKDNFVSENVIHLDPAINRTIEYAIADEFLGIDKNGKIIMTKKSEKLYSDLISNKISNHIISELDRLGKKVSESKLKRIFQILLY